MSAAPAPPLELIVDPSASGELPRKTTTVMLWSTGEDPRLLDAQVFTGAADLRAWLKEAVGKHGAGTIKVRWTRRLLANETVCKLVAACLDTDVPVV
jgi:hypothetical protein